jgi:Fur family transcriptional regulator, ferric uptake regulator
MPEFNSILAKIKEDGHRLTKVRKAMVKIFSEEKCLLTASEFLTRLKSLNLKTDRTTVYRGLCFLVGKKIIRKIQFADNTVYYEITSEHHHHLVCLKCNRVQKIVLDKHLEEQEREIYKKEKFKVSSHSLEFYGLCGNCR